MSIESMTQRGKLNKIAKIGVLMIKTVNLASGKRKVNGNMAHPTPWVAHNREVFDANGDPVLDVWETLRAPLSESALFTLEEEAEAANIVVNVANALADANKPVKTLKEEVTNKVVANVQPDFIRENGWRG